MVTRNLELDAVLDDLIYASLVLLRGMLAEFTAGNVAFDVAQITVKEKRKRFFGTISAVRPVRLEFYDQPFDCPLCGKQIVYASMHTIIMDSRRKCPSCKGELLIHDGTATAISEKKPPKHANVVSPKRSRR